MLYAGLATAYHFRATHLHHLTVLEHIARVLFDRREMDGSELKTLLAEAVTSEDLDGCPAPEALHDE